MNNFLTLETTNQIFFLLNQTYSEPKTELIYHDPYSLAVAVILSAQCTDKKVNKVTSQLFPNFASPKKMIELGKDKLAKIIFPLGLSQAKATNIIKLSVILVEKFDCKLPRDFDELVSLPGIGRKTANVILNNLHQDKRIGVDTHVKRLANRLGFINSENLLHIEKKLMESIPDEWLVKAHNLMVLHGRYVCVARKPKCQECVISPYCLYFKNNENN